nr:hypothetical protein [Solanum melongena]WMB96937.1 hypothetical protein [Solanum melongena]WMB96983.1 hypothetical protein [Solanum melongena]WMB97195.1 hypothetical protein [Solanum aethiopicum]
MKINQKMMKRKVIMFLRSIFKKCFLTLICLFSCRFLWESYITVAASVFAPFLTEIIEFVLSKMEGQPLSLGGGGAGSSGRRPALDFDLNLPPAEDPEPSLPPAREPEPSVDQGPLPLSQAEDKILFRLTKDLSPPLDIESIEMFSEEARRTAQLKGQIVDRMVELDPQSADFWRQHRDTLISNSILTKYQTEYSPHLLEKMVEELTQEGAATSRVFQKMDKIHKKKNQLGTFFY